MSIFNIIPGVSFVNHVIDNIGKGIREEGLMGAIKVVGKGLSKDWALGLVGMFIPGVNVAIIGSVGADLLGFADLKSEGKGGKAEGALEPPNFEVNWA